MKLFIPAAIAAILTTFAAQTVAHADYIWATVEGGQVRFALTESAGAPSNPSFEKYVANLTPTSGDKKVALGTPKDGARFASLSNGQNVVQAESIVGVRERNGETYLLVYNAKGATSLAAAGTLTKAAAEVQARRDGDKLVISVRQGGWPVPNSEVWVQWPGEENASSIQTDDKGNVQVAWPAAPRSGFLSIRAKVNVTKSGELEGKKYPVVRHWATLAFPVEGSKVAAEEKAFTSILRASYSGNHEVVGRALFNQTLFAGKLTKSQIEIHLQQRALIHNEVHRILNAANPALHVPYGAEQKNVLVYLFNDLITMGSGWPTEAQARPLTKAFLQEIRDSESKGPYFALGVQHIYYGGITNGGRMIGAKMVDSLKFAPSYYEKSDGYGAYLTEVDKITDPAARAEMIRGGKAAYKYIIDSSNEDVFAVKQASN